MLDREGLIKELKQYRESRGVKVFGNAVESGDAITADFILARERALIEENEILTKTIVDTKNAEIKALIERVEKPLKDAISYGKRVDDSVDRWKVAQVYEDCIDEAIRILEQAKQNNKGE